MNSKQKAIAAVYLKLVDTNQHHPSRAALIEAGVSRARIRDHFGNFEKLKKLIIKEHKLYFLPDAPPTKTPKILIFDIETKPILANVWGLWDQNIALNQIESDWCVLSWSAKWYENEKGTLYGPHKNIMYADQRKKKKISDDKGIIKQIWQLLDEADVVVTQNGKAFDSKKLNTRFILHKLHKPSSYEHIDTLLLAKKHFAFTSNKLAHLTSQLCTKYKKLEHKKFPGFELWKECIAGNQAAWKEMEIYNKHDVLSLEELYQKLAPWDGRVQLSTFTETSACNCGGNNLVKKGFYRTATAKYQRYKCTDCGAETRDRKNLFKNNTLKVGTSR